MSQRLNRNPVKQVFFTWPNTPTTKEALLHCLLELFQLQYAKIVKETHESGEFHLHALVLFSNSYSIPHILKKLKNKYPLHTKRLHVQTARSVKHCYAYLDKEDPHPLVWGTYEEPRGKALPTPSVRWVAQKKHDLLWSNKMIPLPNSPKLSFKVLLDCELLRYSEMTNGSRTFSNLEQVYEFFHVFLVKVGLTVQEWNSIS